MVRTVAVVVTLAGCLAWSACATGSRMFPPDARDASVCPDFRDLKCLSAPECSLDQRRGCRVCQCSPMLGREPVQGIPSLVPPDQRVPGP